ncbi:GntR family transcriptional regulator [Dactylosporangium sp. NPDC048998]|uniref:GntR family transcriptional regulator n=1 Tax=Dactylosporangium sp. NPDC048998 TaxID=3363976 RepID=UPI003711A686
MTEAHDWDLGSLPGRRASLPTEIAAALAAKIRSGELAPGTRLPSEPEFARLLNVSRNTVREAISVLREQGLAGTKQGIGTFTLDPSTDKQFPVEVGIEHLTSTTDMITRAGYKAGARDYQLVTGPGNDTVRQELGFTGEEKVHCIERVRTADNLPVIFCRDHISVARVPDRVMAQYRGDESLFLFLQRECHLEVHAARADILPTLPSPRVADLLAVSRRKPLLVLKQLHYDRNGVPFLYSENYFNLEYMGVHVRRTPVS